MCVSVFVCYSFGDGVTFPIRTVDEDYDRLLGDRQRWMEEGEDMAAGDTSSDNNIGQSYLLLYDAMH